MRPCDSASESESDLDSEKGLQEFDKEYERIFNTEEKDNKINPKGYLIFITIKNIKVSRKTT